MSEQTSRRRGGPLRDPMNRRQFLRQAMLAGLVVPPSVAALGACASSSVVGPGGSAAPGDSPGAGVTIASPENPVRWPVYEDNPPIADGLEPERGGVLQIYNYADYLAPGLVKAFKAKYAAYDIDVQQPTFNDVQEAITKIHNGKVPYDLYFPGYDQISRLVVSKLGRPLNHSYLPNISNVWPTFQDPWYDQGWQYSVPYTIYMTGMGWNSDKVTLSQYNDLPLGQLGLSLMWSGDVVNSLYYLPKGASPKILNFWFPPDGKGLVNNDLMVVLSGGKCPVLAHLFIDFLLEQRNAIRNFRYTGYQPPQNSLDPAALVDEGFLPPNLESATVLPDYFETGYRLIEQTPAAEAAWLAVWQKFKAGS